MRKKGKGSLPTTGPGWAYTRRSHRYQVGINVEYNFWESFELADKQGPGSDVPEYHADQYWRRMDTRCQFLSKLFPSDPVPGRLCSYEQDPRVINGQTFDAIGLQIGFGFPVLLPRQQISFMDLALEAGRRGIPKFSRTPIFASAWLQL